MAVPRDEPSTYVTQLARWISGERSCEWAFWFQAHWQDYERVESDFDFSVWKMDHTKLLRETQRALGAEGYRMRIENQNWFDARHEDSPGIRIGGKPDLVAFREHDNIVLDVKTGRAHDWHAHQVLLPMALLPRSDLDEYRERRFRGRLIYADGFTRELHPQQAEDIYERLPYFLDVLAGPEEEARRVPSWQECRYCPISSAHCPERVESDPMSESGAGSEPGEWPEG